MAISDAEFDNERELQDWTFANHHTFFGNSVFLPGFRISTPAGKGGMPDGFAFNFDQRSWWVIECELLSHGVWQHIAEQITRFVVAIRNPATLRQVRDKLFEKVMLDNSQESVSKALGTDTTRFLQQLEIYLEGVAPSLAIFIDDTDQDLLDFCDALDIPTEIYRIKKFIVNGVCEYFSPDKNLPAVVFDSSANQQEGSSVFDVIGALGGGELLSSKNKCYRLHDGRVVKVQYSKLYDRNQVYWYGINPSSYNQVKALGCTHFIFIMGTDGFLTLPLSVVDRYISRTYVTNNPDGSVRHYHVHITMPPEVRLKGYENSDDMDVTSYFQTIS